MPKTLVLLDGNSLLFRGFFAVRALNTSSGQPTNALFGLTQMLLSLTEKFRPDAMLCAWDTHEPTFRHEAFDGYKGTRSETPSELIAQGPLARRLVEAFSVPAIEAPGFEADDIIGTLATQGRALGYDVLIVTGDSDTLQLVEPGVQVLMTVKGVTDTVLYDTAAVEARYSLKPLQLTDYRALKGDSSDNIPGVPGIGEKTATTLLQQFETVEALEEKLAEVTPARIQEKIQNNLELMRLSKMLAVIRRDVPLPPNATLVSPDDCPPYAPDYERVRALFEEFEFRALLRRLPSKTDTAAASDGSTSEPTVAKTATKAQLTVTVVDSAATAAQLLTAARAAGKVGVRLHTSDDGPLDARLFGVALSVGDGTVYYCPVGTQQEPDASNGLGGLFEAAATPTISAVSGDGATAATAVLGDAAIAAVFHDARTDLTVLFRHKVTVANLAFDTEVGAYLLQAGRRSSFPLHEIARDQAGVLLEPPLDKKERKATDDATFFVREQARACTGADAVRTLQAVQAPLLVDEELTGLLTTLELPLIPILSALERTGLVLDVPLMNRISAELGGKMAALETEIHGLAGETFAVNSPKQLAEVLFEKLKLPSGKKTKTGYSTDADVLEELATDYPIVGLVLQYRELAKLKGTYTDALPLLVRADTHRVHTTLNQTVAATGRLSSINPNLQNIPIRTAVGREVRRAFVAPEGKVLLSADYSQIELRIFAHVSDDADLRAAFGSGEDIHRYTAAKIYNVPTAEVTSDMRRAAKTVNYAVLYGISDFALARQLKIPQSEAKALKASYFARFPGIKTWLDGTIAFAREKGYVKTLYGRRRWIPDINNRTFNFRQAAERAAANMPIQGASADIMKRAMLLVWECLQTTKLPATLLLQIHDELLFEVEADAVAEVGEQVRACMEGAATLAVSLDVDVKTGRSWGEVTKVE